MGDRLGTPRAVGFFLPSTRLSTREGHRDGTANEGPRMLLFEDLSAFYTLVYDYYILIALPIAKS